MEDHINILESNGDEEIGGNKDQKFESTDGEMGEHREENERLEVLLPHIERDYQSMQMEYFFDILQEDKQEESDKATGGAASSHEENDEESELVSLSLGISSKGRTMDIEKKKNSNRTEKMIREENLDNEGLALGLDIRFKPSSSAQADATNNHSPKSSFDEEGRELEELTEMWPPSKVLKTAKTGDGSEPSRNTQLKNARVSIRARCDTQTMIDGCQWRKYGQKIAKGNPCPRSYYRCTVSSSCPVRKQVQRCAEDMSILITTYEGTHNHPLPSSATAMASTTSAAASILQSPSLISQQGLANSDTVPIINPIVAYNLNALTPEQLYFTNSSISTSNFHPTITLDLTAPPTSSYFGKSPPGFSSTPTYSPTNLNISSTFSPLQSTVLDSSSAWNSYSGRFNYGRLMAQNRNQNDSLMNTGKQPFQGYLYQPNYMSSHPISQQPLPDSIASATRAITVNPKFQSALAAALTTYVANGAGGTGVRENHVGAESAALNLKLGGDMSYTKNTVYSSSQNDIGCASSKSVSVSSSALNAQQGNIIFPLAQPSRSSYSTPSKKSNQFLEQRK